LTGEDILFHSFAIIAVISAFFVIFVSNPIYSALFLALTMSVLGAIFFTLQAYFIAVAQITVYAGAVMVLFTMVIMLFDLKKSHEDIFKFSPVALAKILSSALLCGFLMGTSWLALSASTVNPATILAPDLKPKDLEKGSALPAPTQNVTEDANPDEDLTAAEAGHFVEQKDQPEKVKPEMKAAAVTPVEEFGSTASLSRRLFTKYVFAFEAVSLLLLVAIVGVVALAKSKGGTHHVAN
jgi:NADH-quinone oxidoreductase subunit J